LEPLLARLRKQYDYVIIDSSPVFAADDVTTLAPKVDGTLVVVRRRYSRINQVREALELLYQRQTKVLGLIFNRTDSTERAYYYYTNPRYHTLRLPAESGTGGTG
jgi:Mrp family chromosome partitioning ATPase